MAVLIIDCSFGLFGTDCMQVLYLGRAPHTKETLPDFREECRVTRLSRVFRELTGSLRTPGFWGVTLSQSCTCTCSMQTISVITKIIYIYKRTTTKVVSIIIYRHIQSPIYLYMYNFYYKTLEIAEAALVSTYL